MSTSARRVSEISFENRCHLAFCVECCQKYPTEPYLTAIYPLILDTTAQHALYYGYTCLWNVTWWMIVRVLVTRLGFSWLRQGISRCIIWSIRVPRYVLIGHAAVLLSRKIPWNRVERISDDGWLYFKKSWRFTSIRIFPRSTLNMTGRK